MDKNKTNEIEVSNVSDKGQSKTDSLVSLNFFKGDSNCLYVYQKTERLVSALYLLTGLLSDTEPLKTKLRSQGLELLSQNLFFLKNSSGSTTKDKDEFISLILRIISFLEVAKISQLISVMNHEIIVGEFTSVIQFIEGKYPNTSSSVFQSDFFVVEKQLSTSSVFTKSGISENDLDKNFTNHKTNTSVFSGVKDSHTNEPVNNKTSKLKDTKTFAKPNRSEQILSLMKKDKHMTIKDFTTIIKDCSEKTLQRELLSLVAKGLISKEGERRWSKYSLA